MNQRAIVLYLHVHQPYRIRPYSVFDIATTHNYFHDPTWESTANNERVFRRVADKSYLPTNTLLLALLRQHPEFRFSLSITGTMLDQAERWGEDVIDSFKLLIDTGRVEILAETYYHSLAFFYSREEFQKQVTMHAEKIQTLFGKTPQVFRNTELAYNNELAAWSEHAGYSGILAEGWDPVLNWRSPNFVYQPTGTQNIKLLLKNYKLSDDIAFRFSNQSWSEWPLDVKKYNHWLNTATEDQPIINLFMDYETFGEHQWEEHGIFDFFKELPSEWLQRKGNGFATVSDAIKQNKAVDSIDVPKVITWADSERDLTAWLGNSMQQEALRHLYDLERSVLLTADDGLIADWRYLQSSDHTYYMSTKWLNDGSVHAYFSPYDSPYDAFLYFMNALRDIRWRILEHQKGGWQHS